MLRGTPMQHQPSCCLQGWPAAGAPARLGVVPVAYAAQEVHSRRCCGTIAFAFPCDPLAERERQLSGKPQGVSLVTQFFMRVQGPGAADKAASLVR